MQLVEVKAGIYAVDRPEHNSNLGMVRTPDGVVLIDTAQNEDEMLDVLRKAGLAPDDVCLLIVTHAHDEHIGGATLFDCKVVTHQITASRMEYLGKIRATQPLETFNDEYRFDFGGYHFHLTHYGGHKPGSIVVWLPEQKVLYTGDLVFARRYPWIEEGDIPAWIDALGSLGGYGADAILPGHGPICGLEEVKLLRKYLDDTWKRTREHLLAGMTLEETLADTAYLRPEGWGREELFESNIEVMYDLLYEEVG